MAESLPPLPSVRHKYDTALGPPPCFLIDLPRFRIWTICCHDAHMLRGHIHSKQDVEHLTIQLGIDQVTWQVFIFWIGFDDFIRVDGVHDVLPTNKASC